MRTTVLLAVLAAAPAAWAQVPVTLGQGLAGYWKLDEASGTVAADSSGNGLHGTWVGGVSSAAPGNSTIVFPDPACADLDGTSGSIQVPHNAAIDLAGDMSVSFWVRPTAMNNDWQRLVGKGSFNGTRTYGVWLEAWGNNRILWQTSNQGAYEINLFSTVAIPNAAWTHVACTIEGSIARIYINGVESGSQAFSGTRAQCPDPLTFGYGVDQSGSPLHTWFPGRLDEIRIYTRALTAVEAAALAAGQGATWPNAPANVHQYDLSSGAEVLPGGTLAQPALALQAAVSSGAALDVGLEVEVQPVGTAFANVPNRPAGTLVTSGTLATVPVSGLGFSTNYHVQVRCFDSSGQVSAWTCVGTNPDDVNEKDFGTGSPGPAPTVTLAQAVSPSTGEAVPAGAAMMDTKLRVQAVVTDSSIARVRLDMEIAPMGAPFTGIPTASSGYTLSGTVVGAEVAVVPGFYRVQYRSGNSFGVNGGWTAMGGSPDVVVVAVGSGGRGFSDAVGNVPTGCGNSAATGSGALVLSLAALLALRRRI